jgi:hypothetical protein
MNRRTFVQAVAPVTLTLLLSFSDEAYAANRVDDQAFEIELRRRFEALPDFLKREGVRMELASVVWLLSQPSPRIKMIDTEKP